MRHAIKQVQESLQKEEGIDGWLLYDFQKRNPLAVDFLNIPSSLMLTRRLFYWIPKQGTPVKIVHATESHVLEELPGETMVYFTWQVLEKHLRMLLQGKQCIAMEYSPKGQIPALSFVDAGTLEWIREMGPRVVSSANFIQEFLCVLSSSGRKSHLEAAKILEETVDLAWNFLSGKLKKKEKVTELDVQQMMTQNIHAKGCIFEGGLICAVNQNSSNPHYVPTKERHLEIKQGDFVLLDLWCKKKEPGSIYADICRVAVADVCATPRQQEIFSLVRKAQEEATQLLRQRCKNKQEIRGWEVDRAARAVIEEAGFGSYFIHRTGHNIYTSDHGPGTHMDSLETFDDRKIVNGTCFSIEPGIYLPEEFGVRLEYDVLITLEGDVEISGGIQDAIKLLV
jgi:Xaa-Pro aminopeptidase